MDIYRSWHACGSTLLSIQKKSDLRVSNAGNLDRILWGKDINLVVYYDMKMKMILHYVYILKSKCEWIEPDDCQLTHV